MRKIKLAMYVSADGVVEGPAWTAPYWNDEISRLQYDYLFSSEALLLGRVTYEGFKESWPKMTEETGDFGVRMNTMPKYVASRTLTEGEWNATVMKGDVASEVRKLKEQDGGDLLIYGSGTLVDELTRLELIDEYRLMLFPVVVGSGKKLFSPPLPQTPLRLTDSTITATGIAILTYERVAGDTPT
jgi:dihydrofolate reductase